MTKAADRITHDGAPIEPGKRFLVGNPVYGSCMAGLENRWVTVVRRQSEARWVVKVEYSGREQIVASHELTTEVLGGYSG